MACRLCTANDRATLIEELATAFWFNETDSRSWEQAGSHWQPIYRHLAERALATMEKLR